MDEMTYVSRIEVIPNIGYLSTSLEIKNQSLAYLLTELLSRDGHFHHQ